VAAANSFVLVGDSFAKEAEDLIYVTKLALLRRRWDSALHLVRSCPDRAFLIR